MIQILPEIYYVIFNGFEHPVFYSLMTFEEILDILI